MADKSFGVKELNLLNASGTPTVTSPNNLNLNANTVAISTSATVGNNLTVSGQINVGSNIKIGNAGVVTATSFVGSGANLTGISAGISTDPSNVQATWKLGGGSGSGFTFTGPGQDGSEGNPDIYLVRGQRYLFDNTTLAGNHPFEFRNAANDADYTDGVSGAQNGLQYLNVQHDAPARLKYRCTIHTGSMLGDIYIIGGPEVISGVVTATTFVGNLTGNVTGTASANAVLTGSTNNTLVTVTGANAITGESTLTYNGSDTFELQPASATPAVFVGDSNRTGAGQGIAHFKGNWNGTTVARITFDTGDDTTNKDDGFIRFDTSSTGTLTERVRITRDGKLGIGNVSSPDDKVEIRTGANDQGVLIKSTGSTSNAIKFDANRSGANQGLGSIKARWNGTTVAQIFMNTGSDTTDKNDGYIIFGTESAASNGNVNATERMRIESDGTVKFDPSAGGTLKIGGSSAHTSKIVIADNAGTGNGNCLVEGGDGTDFFTIQSNGNVAFTNGRGINFAATSDAGNSATMSNELFDDYEEGSWSPTGSWTTIVARYTKIGRMVFAGFSLRANTSSGNVTIGGFPFASASNHAASGGIAWGLCEFNSSGGWLNGSIGDGETSATIRKNNAAVLTFGSGQNNMNQNAFIRGTFIYHTA